MWKKGKADKKAAGGGGDPVKMAAMDAQIQKLTSTLEIAKDDLVDAQAHGMKMEGERDDLLLLEQIAQDDLVDAQQEATEAKATSEAVMVEGRNAQDEMQKMAKQREEERALAMRAVGVAAGDTVILLHPPPHLVGVSTGVERGCQ